LNLLLLLTCYDFGEYQWYFNDQGRDHVLLLEVCLEICFYILWNRGWRNLLWYQQINKPKKNHVKPKDASIDHSLGGKALQVLTVVSNFPSSGSFFSLLFLSQSYCVDNLIYVVSIASGTSWETGVRRSTRIRSRPLEYWKGERFLYGRIHGSKSHHTLSCAFQYTRNLFCHDTVLHLDGLY